MQLFPYQVEGVAFLSARKRALMFDVPGLGKTPQAIKAADAVFGDQPATVVVVCPASLVTNWTREIERWRTGRWTATVVSYDKLVRSGYEGRPDLVVLDESHYCKTPSAKRTKAALKLAHGALYAWALTGTPAPNSPHELFTLLRVFATPVVTDKNGKITNHLAFIRRYCLTQPNPFGIMPKVVGTKNGPELKARLQPFMIRRTKKEVLKDLPPLVQANLYVSLSPGQHAAVKRLEAELGPEAMAAVEDGRLAVLQGEHIAKLRRLTGTIKATGVADIVREELDGGLDKIVVFAHHRDVLDILEAELGAYGAVRLDGSKTGSERMDAVDQFQNFKNVQVFLGQITAAGVGLTLTAAQNAIFAEMSWVPAENEQAAQRIHRVGQKGSCLVRYAILPNSLDEQIATTLQRKMGSIAQVFA